MNRKRRKRIQEIQSAMLDYVDRAADAVEDVQKAQKRGATVLVDRDVYYALLAATTSALDSDERRGEVRATLIVAAVATFATIVQAVAMVIELIQG